MDDVRLGVHKKLHQARGDGEFSRPAPARSLGISTAVSEALRIWSAPRWAPEAGRDHLAEIRLMADEHHMIEFRESRERLEAGLRRHSAGQPRLDEKFRIAETLGHDAGGLLRAHDGAGKNHVRHETRAPQNLPTFAACSSPFVVSLRP